MSIRPAWYVKDGFVFCKNQEFEWFSGFSLQQKQKCINSLHSQLKGNALEISTKSESELGKKLSAFNLKLDGITLECIFQSSKVFEKGGPYLDLLNCSPKDAKCDERLKTSGKLVAFEYNGERFPLEPETFFYDYIYIKAAIQTLGFEKLKEVLKYDYFTDIEFNPEKSINCQARTVAEIKMLIEKFGEFDFSRQDFLKCYAFIK